jgi:hypothetical protein
VRVEVQAAFRECNFEKKIDEEGDNSGDKGWDGGGRDGTER